LTGTHLVVFGPIPPVEGGAHRAAPASAAGVLGCTCRASRRWRKLILAAECPTSQADRPEGLGAVHAIETPSWSVEAGRGRSRHNRLTGLVEGCRPASGLMPMAPTSTRCERSDGAMLAIFGPRSSRPKTQADHLWPCRPCQLAQAWPAIESQRVSRNAAHPVGPAPNGCSPGMGAVPARHSAPPAHRRKAGRRGCRSRDAAPATGWPRPGRASGAGFAAASLQGGGSPVRCRNYAGRCPPPCGEDRCNPTLGMVKLPGPACETASLGRATSVALSFLPKTKLEEGGPSYGDGKRSGVDHDFMDPSRRP